MLRPRRSRFKGLSINRLIPNILTMLALCAGLTAIRFGLQEQWEWAVFAVIVAAVLDALDGRIARLLGGTSRFGAELDSLSDFVSFGVAPAILLFFWTMRDARGVGWALVLLFSICCALRLARFNITSGNPDLPPWAYNYFTGVPAPAAAGLALLPMMLTFVVGPGVFDLPVVNAVVVAGVALLMISRIPTYSLKQVKVPNRYVVPMLVAVGLVAAFLATAHWATISALMIAYLVSIPFSLRSFRHLRREAERIQAHGHHARPEAVEDAAGDPEGEEGGDEADDEADDRG